LRKINHIFCILQKDFTDAVKNKTVFFSIAIPVLLSLVFSIVLKPRELSKINLVIVDRNNSKLAGALTEASNRSEKLKVTTVEDFESAKDILQKGNAQAILIFPENYDKQLESGENLQLDLWVGQSGLRSAQVIKDLLNKILYYCKYEKVLPDFVNTKCLYGKNYSPRTAMLPTWILFTVIGGYMVVATSIMEEREKKTLPAILVTPCRMPSFLVGKGLLGVVLVMMGGCLILGLNRGFMGNVPAVMLILLLGAALFSILGILTGLILPSQTSISTFGSLLFLALFLPVTMAPVSNKLLAVAKLLPSYYIHEGIIDSMFMNAGIHQLSVHLAYLSILGVLFFILSLAVLKKKEDF